MQLPYTPCMPLMTFCCNLLQGLLAYVAMCQRSVLQLDTINLVTVCYRLAKMYNCIYSAKVRAAWHAELMAIPAFGQILGVCALCRRSQSYAAAR